MNWPSPFTSHRSVQVGAVETHVAACGDGPPVLFLHGNPDTHSVWSSTVALLTGYRCLAPDLPGFGASRAPADFDMSLENQGDFVRGLAAALELDRFHLVVHDIGGAFGLAFAAQHPERVLSLTMFNTGFFPDLRWHFWARVWRTRVLGEISLALMNRPLFARELKRGSPGMPPEYAAHAYGELTPAMKKITLRWYRAMDPDVWTGWDTRFLAATETVPKLTLWGDLDPFLPSSFADRFGGEAKHVADCGHWLMVEQPGLAATAMRALFER